MEKEIQGQWHGHNDLKRPDDTSRININDQDEIAYWAAVLNVEAERIVEAVRTVGVSSIAVRVHLKSH